MEIEESSDEFGFERKHLPSQPLISQDNSDVNGVFYNQEPKQVKQNIFDMSTTTFTNFNNQSPQAEISVQSKENKKHKIRDSLKQVVFGTQIIRPLAQRQAYYLIGDISIDFDLIRGKESRFSPLKDFRPVVSVERDIFNQYIEVKLDTVQKGITNFKQVITQLDSMNDQFAHGIAVLLNKYQKVIDFKLKMLNSITGAKSNTFSIEQFYFDSQAIAKQVIAEKRKTTKYFAYFIMKGQYLDSTMMSQGVSEQLLEVLGLDCDTFKSISLRRGLLDFVDPFQRYFIIIEKFASVAKTRKPWDQVDLISIDNFRIPVEVSNEKVVLNKEKCYENHIQFLNIKINEKVLSDLKIKRYRAHSILSNQNYLTLGEELTYSLETEVFLEHFYPKKRLVKLEEIQVEVSKEEENTADQFHKATEIDQVFQQSFSTINSTNNSTLDNSFNSYHQQVLQNPIFMLS